MSTANTENSIDLSSPEFYFNRELSHMQFNIRVLEQALDDAHPLLKERVQTTFSLWHNELVGIVVESQRKMEVNPVVDPVRFSNTFIAMLEGGILVAKTMNQPEYFNQVASSIHIYIQTNLELKTNA
jgi:hypothetical protein